MDSRISLLTLGVAELSRSKRFYTEGFGWTPIFENEEIVFYQLGGLVFSTFLTPSLAADMRRDDLRTPGAFSIAHNVRTREEVEPLLARLQAAGGRLLKAALEPPIPGYHGYVADPDEHAWETAWNPGFSITPAGETIFGV